MATHKVPQDVESEDKLVGPLSLKQFIFTILGLASGYLVFFFFTKVHPITSVIWLPFMIGFFVLGLYQRKDQPVEVFLASAFRFYFKPRTRIWGQDGYEERVVVTAPVEVERHYTKNFTGKEAVSRLGRLSNMMDSRGWASKNVSDWQNPQLAETAASSRIVQVTGNQGSAYSQSFLQPTDVHDSQTSPIAREFQTRVNQSNLGAKQQAIKTMEAARSSASGIPNQSVTPPSHRSYPAHTDQRIASQVQQNDPAQQSTVKPRVQEVERTAVPREDLKPTLNADPEPAIPKTASRTQIAEDGSVEIKLH